MLQPVAGAGVRAMMRAMLCVAVMATAAHADVRWDAPSTCPTAETMRARIGDGLEVRVEITGRFTAHLVIGAEERTLTARRCDDLADAVVLIVARLARAQHRTSAVVVVVDEPAEALPPELEVEMPAADLRRPRVEMMVAEVEPARWGMGVRVLGLSGIGAVPEVGLGAEVAGYLRHDDHFVEIATARWQTGGAFRSRSSAHVDLDVAMLRVGWSPQDLPIRIWGQTELGNMAEEQVGDATSNQWVALGGGFGVAWPMHPNARLVGAFEAAVPVVRPELGAYSPSTLTTRVSFGIELGWK